MSDLHDWNPGGDDDLIEINMVSWRLIMTGVLIIVFTFATGYHMLSRFYTEMFFYVGAVWLSFAGVFLACALVPKKLVLSVSGVRYVIAGWTYREASWRSVTSVDYKKRVYLSSQPHVDKNLIIHTGCKDIILFGSVFGWATLRRTYNAIIRYRDSHDGIDFRSEEGWA